MPKASQKPSTIPSQKPPIFLKIQSFADLIPFHIPLIKLAPISSILPGKLCQRWQLGWALEVAQTLLRGNALYR